MARNPATTPVGAEAWGVYDSPPDEISAWGTDGSGADFCCSETAGRIEILTLLGTDLADDLRFQDVGAGLYLFKHPGAARVEGHAIGRAGDDELEGSLSDDCANYRDILMGDDDADTLIGNDGCDTLQGGGGADTLLGGDHDDLLYGDAGADVIYGGANQDTVYGGSGDDRIEGGDGSDLLHGDGGDDTVCDQASTTYDDLTGDSGVDKLWAGGQTGDVSSCGGTTGDQAGAAGSGTIFGCPGTILTSAPASCPP